MYISDIFHIIHFGVSKGKESSFNCVMICFKSRVLTPGAKWGNCDTEENFQMELFLLYVCFN